MKHDLDSLSLFGITSYCKKWLVICLLYMFFSDTKPYFLLWVIYMFLNVLFYKIANGIERKMSFDIFSTPIHQF